MPYYKDLNNKLHFLEDKSFIYLLPPNCTQISDDEANNIQNPPLTLEQLSIKMESIVQNHLDDIAKQRGYDGILSACSYAGAQNPFQAESQAYTQWRGNVWEYCYQTFAAVKAGQREIPEDIISELPVLVLP